MRFATLALAASFLVPTAAAQADPAFGDCTNGRAFVDLSAADVRARMFNTGGLFWRGGDAHYEVPKDGGIQSIFAANVWIGATVNGEIRMAAATYAQGAGETYELYPGRLGPDGSAPTAADCAAADRIWRVTVDDVAAYNADGTATPDLLAWPAELGAPVVDGDGVLGNYDLAAGDRPKVLGFETAWWILNDRGGRHGTTDSQPLGIEVAVTAFTFPADYVIDRFGRPSAGFADEMALMTFYRYQVRNGNATDVFEDMTFSFWADYDLGNAGDDYVGSNPDLDLGYAYNADDDDGSFGYGDRPPAIGVTFLNQPMTAAVNYSSCNGPNCNPDTAPDYYGYSRAIWLDGQPITYGFDGRNASQPPTRFMFPSAPPDYWSEYDQDPAVGEQPIAAGDRRYVMATERPRLSPGETWTVDFAIVWSRVANGSEDESALASLSKLFRDVDITRDIYTTVGLYEPDPRLLTILPPSDDMETTFPDRLGLGERPRPNPVVAGSVLDVAVPEGVEASIEVFDALGRRIAEMPLVAGQETVALGALDLAPGSYIARLRADGQVGRRVVQFIVAR